MGALLLNVGLPTSSALKTLTPFDRKTKIPQDILTADRVCSPTNPLPKGQEEGKEMEMEMEMPDRMSHDIRSPKNKCIKGMG